MRTLTAVIQLLISASERRQATSSCRDPHRAAWTETVAPLKAFRFLRWTSAMRVAFILRRWPPPSALHSAHDVLPAPPESCRGDWKCRTGKWRTKQRVWEKWFAPIDDRLRSCRFSGPAIRAVIFQSCISAPHAAAANHPSTGTWPTSAGCNWKPCRSTRRKPTRQFADKIALSTRQICRLPSLCLRQGEGHRFLDYCAAAAATTDGTATMLSAETGLSSWQRLAAAAADFVSSPPTSFLDRVAETSSGRLVCLSTSRTWWIAERMTTVSKAKKKL